MNKKKNLYFKKFDKADWSKPDFQSAIQQNTQSEKTNPQS